MKLKDAFKLGANFAAFVIGYQITMGIANGIAEEIIKVFKKQEDNMKKESENGGTDEK